MRHILLLSLFLIFSQCVTENGAGIIMTVKGPIRASEMGSTLIHEHVLVDFIGADKITNQRWDKPEVIKKVLPYLKEVKDLGVRTLIECTPAYLGRDPLLLKALSDSSGLHILTNTGYYGARNNLFLPAHAFTESAAQLAERWIREWEDGIAGTGIRPGFIKIGVESDSLSALHQKLVRAAAITHLKTGLTIASHTGPALPALKEIKLLKSEGVSPNAFIWVHAQAEEDYSNHVLAAKKGAWISLDGFSDDHLEKYINMINNLKKNNLLKRVLLSHDAGWYSPGEENGGKFGAYTSIFTTLIPALKQAHYTEKEIEQLFVKNPMEAFKIRVRNNE